MNPQWADEANGMHYRHCTRPRQRHVSELRHREPKKDTSSGHPFAGDRPDASHLSEFGDAID
ncbi:hypothetical protein ACFXKS_38670 [Streptomyces scopuliridis]|uniref:hypothetical protein n=1 Tax=Streptomyces scopuliridis TaxID=452529 RepID=UPI0036998DEC